MACVLYAAYVPWGCLIWNLFCTEEGTVISRPLAQKEQGSNIFTTVHTPPVEQVSALLFQAGSSKKPLYFIGFESDDIVNCLDVWFIKLEGNPPAEGKTKRHCMFAMIHQNVPINHWSMTSNQAVPRIQLDRVLPWALGATDPTPAVFFLAPLSGCRRSSAASMMRFSDSDPMFSFPWNIWKYIMHNRSEWIQWHTTV